MGVSGGNGARPALAHVTPGSSSLSTAHFQWRLEGGHSPVKDAPESWMPSRAPSGPPLLLWPLRCAWQCQVLSAGRFPPCL